MSFPKILRAVSALFLLSAISNCVDSKDALRTSLQAVNLPDPPATMRSDRTFETQGRVGKKESALLDQCTAMLKTANDKLDWSRSWYLQRVQEYKNPAR